MKWIKWKTETRAANESEIVENILSRTRRNNQEIDQEVVRMARLPDLAPRLNYFKTLQHFYAEKRNI